MKFKSSTSLRKDAEIVNDAKDTTAVSAQKTQKKKEKKETTLSELVLVSFNDNKLV